MKEIEKINMLVQVYQSKPNGVVYLVPWGYEITEGDLKAIEFFNLTQALWRINHSTKWGSFAGKLAYRLSPDQFRVAKGIFGRFNPMAPYTAYATLGFDGDVIGLGTLAFDKGTGVGTPPHWVYACDKHARESRLAKIERLPFANWK